jgi:hypothetical protein
MATLEQRQERIEEAEELYLEARNTWVKGDKTGLHAFERGCMYQLGVCSFLQEKFDLAM